MFDFNRLLFVPYESLGRMYSLKIRKKNGFPACLVDIFLTTRIFANKHFFLLGLRSEHYSLKLDPNRKQYPTRKIIMHRGGAI